MNIRFQQFKNNHRRGFFVVFLFCVNFLALLLSHMMSLLQNNPIKPLQVVFVAISLFSFFVMVLLLIKNWCDLKKFEGSYFYWNEKTYANRLKLFNKLLADNLLQYYFQPIINTKTGEVFAYEALMRTDDRIAMAPDEILDIASKENRLYEIEKLTLTNTLNIMRENYEPFYSKKLFINSISNHLLTDEDFDALYHEYGTLFDNIVLEITETSMMDDSRIDSIHQRLNNYNFQIALDDYGSDHSNETLLLNTSPNYIKIDHIVLRNIHVDSKKQHLVTNIISFAKNHHIKTIAEGVETYDEFVYLLKLGVDYIQGFYTGRPKPFLIESVSDECLDIVFAMNQKHYLESMVKRVFDTTNDLKTLSLVNLSLEQYTDICINDKDITLQGCQDIITSLKIHIADNLKCSVTLDNVSLKGDAPCITLGHNCSVELRLVGDNILYYDGIRVPESSELVITGDGNLTIQADRRDGTGIGGNMEQSYGNITLAGTGIIKIINEGDMVIGIGGAYNTFHSKIHITSGIIQIETSGYEAVGIGCVNGKAQIISENCHIQITSLATKTVAIGSLKGQVDIEVASDLNLRCDGSKSVALGVLENGEGLLTILRGNIRIHYHAHTGAGIGTIGGNMDIKILNGDINIYAEGTDVVGIGDSFGSGDIIISNGIISTEIYASHPISIGNSDRIVVIDGGNIQCRLPQDITIINSNGALLDLKVITNPEYYQNNIDTGPIPYIYSAEYSELYSDIRVYLPKSIEI